MTLIPVNEGFTIETLERLQKTGCQPCQTTGWIEGRTRPADNKPVRMRCPQCAGRGYVYRENQTKVRLRI